MGNYLTVDKHVSHLDDLLQLTPRLLAHTKFQGNPSTVVTHHLKVWKFLEEDSKQKLVGSLPFLLTTLANAPATINSNETYLVLLITNNKQLRKSQSVSAYITATIQACISTFTPRGLRSSLAETPANVQSNGYTYYLYLYNGNNSPSHIKAYAFAKAFQLENLINSCATHLLPILFGGGVVRNKKLQKGSVIELNKDELALSTTINTADFDLARKIYQRQNCLITNLMTLNPYPLKQIENTNPNIKKQSLTINVSGVNSKLKTPLLNLSLKPFQQTKYEQIQEQFQQGTINFDIRATARHQLKMEHFQTECSQILPGVYVSGQKVAKNFHQLKKLEITHVVNCAADYCENWFQKQGLTYIAFFLKDSQNQSIECLFYKVIDFIDNALSQKKKVLVHCIQGVSRSVTMVIAYVMFKMKYDYKQAEAFVKQKRAVASPNNGFMVQLIQFHKRLYQNFQSLPCPRVFVVSSHCKQTPEIITARLLKYSVFQKRKNIGLDCRDVIYLWIGCKCSQNRVQRYWSYAQEYIQKLQKYERAPQTIQVITQGSQGHDFYEKLWGLQQIPELYQNPEYNNLFVDFLKEGDQIIKPGANRKYFNSEMEQEEENIKIKYKMFLYPDTTKGLGVFEMEDLAGLSMVFRQDSNNLQVYIWRSKECSLTIEQQRQFLDELIENYYSQVDTSKIYIFHEYQHSQTDEFLQCFQ